MPEDSPSDAELLTAHGRGDPDAFAELYGRRKAAVFGLCRRFGRDREEALDLLQEAFLYLARKAPGIRLQHQVTTLLYPVIKHLARDRQRRAAPKGLEEVAEPWVIEGLPDDLQGLLRGLSAEQQEILLLRYRDGLEVRELAVALGIPEGTAKSRLHGARRALRDRLEKSDSV